jgi:hypothetical protein
MRDNIILLTWIIGFLLLISMLWILTGPLQTNYLLRTVNNVFINNNDSRRLSGYVRQKAPKAGLLGYWFSMHNSQNKIFVFTVFQDGMLAPIGAIVSPDGTVEEMMPLSAHAVQIFNRLPDSILQIYVSRIEVSSMQGGRE